MISKKVWIAAVFCPCVCMSYLLCGTCLRVPRDEVIM